MVKKRILAIIAKMAPAHCGTTKTKITFSDSREEEKKKNRKKTGFQMRHRAERKPLKAKKALKALWDSEKEKTVEHADAILARIIACRHISPKDFAECSLVKEIRKTLQELLKEQPKPANRGRKKQAKHVDGRRRGPQPGAERWHTLTGGSFRALFRGLLLLSCCVRPNVGLAPAVKTGPSSYAALAVPGSMRSASSAALTPPMPPLECALEVSFPSVTSSSFMAHDHTRVSSFPREPKILHLLREA